MCFKDRTSSSCTVSAFYILTMQSHCYDMSHTTIGPVKDFFSDKLYLFSYSFT